MKPYLIAEWSGVYPDNKFRLIRVDNRNKISLEKYRKDALGNEAWDEVFIGDGDLADALVCLGMAICHGDPKLRMIPTHLPQRKVQEG